MGKHIDRSVTTKKYTLQIPLAPNELAEIEQMYGTGHGLAARCRSDLLALARARAGRAAKQVQGMTVQPSKPHGVKGWLRDRLVEKYGIEQADKILSGQAAEPQSSNAASE